MKNHIENIKSYFHLSLGVRLISLITITFIFFSFLFVCINFLLFYKSSTESFYKKTITISDFSANSNSANIWNFDYVNIKKYIESLLGEKELVAVIFDMGKTRSDPQKRRYFGMIGVTMVDAKAINIDEVAPNKTMYSAHMERPIFYNDFEIGKVHLYFSDKFILKTVFDELKIFSINILVFIVVFSLSIFYILKIQLISPIKRIHKLALSVSSFTTYLGKSVSQEKWGYVQNLLNLEKNNQERLSVNGASRGDELGDLMQTFILVLDGFEVVVGELTQYSAQLQMMNIELEDRIRIRTLELEESNRKINESLVALQKTQGQLVQQEKLASIGQLAAGVAHEINNPIGYVGSNINRVDEYFKDLNFMVIELEKVMASIPYEGMQEIFSKIEVIKKNIDYKFLIEDFALVISDCKEGISRVKDIVQSLKDFSHNVDDKEFSEVNINDAITTTLKVVNNEIKYSCDVALDLKLQVSVAANLGQIHQVMSNLIVNAAHAMKDTSQRGLLTVRTYSENDYAYVEIEDTGKGIPEEIRSKVFDPFFTTKPIGQGTGLGLNISYDIIVNKHKGDLSFESQVGVGTIFRIKLPLEREML